MNEMMHASDMIGKTVSRICPAEDGFYFYFDDGQLWTMLYEPD